MQGTRRAELDTILGADSVVLLGDAEKEDGATRQRAVVGTYSLQNESGKSPHREGRLLLVSATREGNGCTLASDGEVTDIPGVLDVTEQADPDTLYVACACDTLFSFDVRTEEKQYLQSRREVWEADDPERIVLSVDVSESNEGTHDPLVAASDSTGGVSVYRAMRLRYEPVLQRATHEQEAWSVLVDGPREAVYSGGDDGVLACYEWKTDTECFRLSKSHGGIGVTTVTKDKFQRSASDEFEMWTGGYDDMLKLWDIRSMKSCVSELDVGGGVWRVRFHPKEKELLLLATMYDGFKVVRRDSSDQLSVACHYQGHESLAYGATWVPSLDDGAQHVAMTASFYDHSLQLWTVDAPT